VAGFPDSDQPLFDHFQLCQVTWAILWLFTSNIVLLRSRALSSVSDASWWSSIETREWAWYFFSPRLVRDSKQAGHFPSMFHVCGVTALFQYEITSSLFTLNPRDPR
jgi:hypothetical protein